MNVLKLGKKVLTVSTVFSTILWSVGVSALVPAIAQADTCPSFKSGDLLKVSGRAAIYAVDSNGKVLYFPSGDEFKSWNSDEKYGGYTTVSQACYDSLPVPSTAPLGVNFRPGSYVVKRASSDQLYVVEPGNTLATITVDAAKALYGTSYKVKTVADVFWPNYGQTRGAAVTEAKAHPGMLVSNGGKTYYVNTDGTLSEVSAAGFTANRFKTAFVRPLASLTGYSFGAEIAAAVGNVSDRTQTGGAVATIPGGTVSGGSVSVALASDNPAGTYLASGTAFNPVLKITLTAGSQDVAVTGLTLKKSGFTANSSVSGIDVVDASGVRHGNVASSVDTDNNVNLLFSGAPVTVKANSSQTLTVRVNLSGDTGTLQFSLAGASGVTTNGGSVSGNFPVTGNVFTLQSGSNSVASVTLDVQPINAAGAQLNIDTQNEQDITKFAISETQSRENVSFSSLTLYNIGNAADTDVQDVQLVAQDGTVLATAQQSNKQVVFNLATPYNIDKGTTKYFTVRAKIVNGASRTIQFTVYNNYDVAVKGASTGAFVLPAAGSVDTTFPIGDATNYNKVTVGSGTLSFNKDTSSPSSAVTPGQNSVVVAKYFVKPTGENMELRQITLAVVTSSASVITGSVAVKVNGASVYSADPKTIGDASGRASTITLSTYPTLVAGQNSYITVETNIMSGAASGQTVQAYVNIQQVKRLVTNDLVTNGAGFTTNQSAGNQLSVQGSALKVTTMATPVAQSVVAGTAGVTLANIELNAGAVSSGEDVKVSKIIVSDITTGTLTDIGNLAMYDAAGNQLATTASTATNAASSSFNFATPIVVPKSGAVTLTLKGDVLTGSSGGHRFVVASSTADVTATGVSTGNTVFASLGAGGGQILTVTGSGTLTLSAVTGGSAAPANDQTVLVGATAVPVFAFKLTAQNEPIKITSLKLTASGTLNSVNDVVNLKLYRDNDTQPFATAGSLTAGASTASTSYTWTATDNLLPAAVQPGSPVTIYVKADIGVAGNSFLGDSFRFSIATNTDIGAKGASSGTTLTNSAISGTPSVTAFSYITPFSVSIAGDAPTGGSQTQAIAVGTQVARFKVTNNGTSKVTLTDLKFTNNGSTGATALTMKLYYSDQNSTNYTQNIASSSQVFTGLTTSTLNFFNLGSSGGSSSFTIDGGAYRYVTVVINSATGLTAGDSFQFAVSSLGDVKYSVAETDLGYDGNLSGGLSGSISNLIVDGKPSLGTLVKQ